MFLIFFAYVFILGYVRISAEYLLSLLSPSIYEATRELLDRFSKNRVENVTETSPATSACI
jgi:hypothetical protein